MKAVVFHDVGDIRLEDVEEPKIQNQNDAIVRLTAAAICGTDLHFVRGTVPGLREGTILGHEGIGIVEEVGAQVRNFRQGDRVVVLSTIACGYCPFCRQGDFSQCDNANPNGPNAGTAFYGGPASTGPFDGMQAELVRVPFANVGMVKIPDNVTDDQAIMLSDIFPTGYFGADLADVEEGNTVAVFGCGPVGQFAIISCLLRGADRIIAVDEIDSRLEHARDLGAEIVNFANEDPLEAIAALTGGVGTDKAIDAVGVDASSPKGEAPSQALQWGVQGVAKAGTVSIIGVYPPSMTYFPFGTAFGKDLTVRAGNCNHRKYVSMLMNVVAGGVVDPTVVLTEKEPLTDVIDAYRMFDEKKPGWMKVEVEA
jgi:threonine dehydrogenase-like Zn-dependent dehydrogenase